MTSKTFLDVIEEGAFEGSYEELKRLAKKWRGKWYDMKNCKRFDFVPGSDVEEVYFWPETGKVAHCRYDRDKPARQSMVDWQAHRNGCQDERHWRVYDFRHLGRRSLPELFFEDQQYFLESVMFDDEDIGAIDNFELGEMMDKVRTIRIPRRFPQIAKVVHQYDGRESGLWRDFWVTERPLSKFAKGGLFLVSDRIDMAETAWDFYGDCCPGIVDGPLMAVLTGDLHAKWSRRQCEAFFDEPKHFVPITGRFQRNEFSNRRKLTASSDGVF